MPVPGDLPVFLEIALAVCGRQQAGHRVETIVVPDKPTAAVTNVVERARATWDGDLKVAPLPLPERYVLPPMHNPFLNYGVQVLTGVTRSRASHVILHDADLFLLADSVLEEQWGTARERDLVVHGVSEVWDRWFRDKGIHIAATWELCLRTDWMRSFVPRLHMGHTAELFGEEHVFDITLHPQALTDPRRIAVTDRGEQIVHFNHVIATYRAYQKSPQSFHDDAFLLLLVRLFVDLFAQEPYDYDLPSLDEMARGLTDPTGTVRYDAPDDDARARYAAFRGKVVGILDGAWSPEEKRTRATEALVPFDRHYGYLS